MEKNSKLLNELKKGCFYFSQVADGEALLWVFVYCDDISESVCGKIVQLAKDSGGFQLVEFPDKKDLLESMVGRFLETHDKFSPGQVFEQKLIN